MRASPLLLLAPFLAAVGLFGRYVCDDDLIMLRYAERLAEGRGLTWNDGERVHGVSAMLLVLLSAGLRLLGVPLEVTMRLLSSAGVLVSGLVIAIAALRVGVSRWSSVVLGGALILSAPFAVWAFAGVGGVVLSALSGIAVLLATDSRVRPNATPGFTGTVVFPVRSLAVLLMLLQVVRPDALVLVVPILVLAYFGSRDVLPGRAFVFRLLVPVLGFAVLFAFVQLLYFATPVPHLAGVKTTWSLEFVRVGILYVLEFLRGFFPLVAAAPLLLLLSPSRRSFPVLAPLLPAAVWVIYVIWIGGDWMPGNRHFAVVLLLVLISLVRASAYPDARRRLRTGALLVVAVAAAGVSITAPAATRSRDAIEWLEVTCDGSETLAALVGHLDPLLGVEPAGCPPYVTGMRSLDLLGLNDIHVSRTVPKGRPLSWDEWVRMQSESPEELPSSFIPGHGNGDGTYIWNREPDLLVGCNPPRSAPSGCFRSFFEMQERFDFPSRYQPLVIELDSGALWHAWVRFDAGPLGVQVSSDGDVLRAVDVPVWLLASSSSAPLRVLDPATSSVGEAAPATGRIALRAGSRVELPVFPLPEGVWEIDGVPGSVSVSSSSSCAQVDGLVLKVSSAACRVSLGLSASAESSLGDVSVRAVR